MRRLLPVRRLRRSPSRRDQRGAAAVEFALLSLLLFTMVGGIVDYGLWFADTLSARHGVREAARSGVVGQTVTCAGTTAPVSLSRVACAAKEQSGTITGDTFARVAAPQGWGRGKPLVVCLTIRTDAVTGIAPLPGKFIRAKSQMAIEADSATLTAPAPVEDALPAGATWGWCT